MKQLRSRRGSTMVEVLVALVIVMAMMTVFAAAVTTSMTLINRSEAVLEGDRELQQARYRTDAVTQPLSGALTLNDETSGAVIPLPDTCLEEFTYDGSSRTDFGTAP